MKKYVVILTAVFALPVFASACDICGCGVGNSYIGILPDFTKTIFGVRYRYNSLLTHIGAGGVTTYLTTKETYRTAELWGGWNISTNFRIMASAPYSFNERVNQGIPNSKSGIGDVFVSGYYQIINSRKTVFSDKLLVQSLWVGAGAKLPTGKYNPSDKAGTNQNTNLFQLGTASTDFTVNAMYDVRLQDAGLNLSSGYKINTANKFDYQYGNKLSANAQAYYKFRIKNKIILAPNTGIQYENAQKDMDRKFAVDISGGNLLLGTIGVETSFRKISIGGNWQSPLSQNLGNGFVKAGNRMMAHISFML